MKRTTIVFTALMVSFSSSTFALDAYCKLPGSFQVSELSREQIEGLHRVAGLMLAERNVPLEEFEDNRNLVETSAFAAVGIEMCEHASGPVVSLARDPRLSVAKLLNMTRKASSKVKNASVICATEVKLKTKTCFEMALIE